MSTPYGLMFHARRGAAVLWTAYAFATVEHAAEVAKRVLEHGPEELDKLGVAWDPLEAWERPILSATVQDEDWDLRRIKRRRGKFYEWQPYPHDGSWWELLKPKEEATCPKSASPTA